MYQTSFQSIKSFSHLHFYPQKKNFLITKSYVFSDLNCKFFTFFSLSASSTESSAVQISPKSHCKVLNDMQENFGISEFICKN